jgi:magnesium-transporting ATPase (P-type)
MEVKQSCYFIKVICPHICLWRRWGGGGFTCLRNTDSNVFLFRSYFCFMFSLNKISVTLYLCTVLYILMQFVSNGPEKPRFTGHNKNSLTAEVSSQMPSGKNCVFMLLQLATAATACYCRFHSCYGLSMLVTVIVTAAIVIISHTAYGIALVIASCYCCHS